MKDLSPTGARRAALALHGLEASDQQWVLAALDAGQQAVLRPLLLELLDIGMPAEGSFVEDLCGGAPPRPPGRATQELAAMSALLRDESPRLVAALLSGLDEAERGGLLTGFPPAARSGILAHEVLLVRAPALQAAVLAAARRRLVQPSPLPAPKVSAAWGRLKSRLHGRRSRS